MKVSLFYLPSIGPREAIEEGRAGLRNDLYQQMLRELVEQAQLADRLGYDSLSFTEHHFHVEGFELSNNPVLLDLYVGLQTERIRVGQLGIVLPAQNPLRVAEDIAMLDHMTGGRANAGFARGYQRRWVDTMAQHLHGIHGATPWQHDALDEANRAAFEEHFAIIKRAWTEDFLTFEGRYWRIPPEGTPWPLEATRRWGGGVDADGMLRAISVVPKPLQKPHPPLFQPFASSERTIRWCAREGVTAVLPPMWPGLQARLFDAYREEAAAHGRELEPGEGLAVLRDLLVLDSDAEARHWWERGAAFCGAAWFAPVGFSEALRPPGGPAPTVDEMFDLGLVLVGSPATVRRQLSALRRQAPVQWVFAWMYNGLIPHEKLMRSLELFAAEVLPEFGGLV